MSPQHFLQLKKTWMTSIPFIGQHFDSYLLQRDLGLGIRCSWATNTRLGSFCAAAACSISWPSAFDVDRSVLASKSIWTRPLEDNLLHLLQAHVARFLWAPDPERKSPPSMGEHAEGRAGHAPIGPLYIHAGDAACSGYCVSWVVSGGTLPTLQNRPSSV